MEMNVSTSEKLQDAEFERDLLGMMIIKKGACIPKVTEILSVDDFQFALNRKIFKAIMRIYARRTPPNLALLIEEIKSSEDYNRDVLQMVLDLCDNVFTDAYAVTYARQIKEKSLRRQFSSYVSSLDKQIANPSISISEIIYNAENNLRAFNRDVTPAALLDQDDYFSHMMSAEISICSQYANRKTGYSNIDQHQIFSPGLYVLGATPACGKTTFAWQLLNQLSSNGERCIFCSYEMSRLELYSKSLARELFLRDENTIFTAADIRNGAQSEELDALKIDFATGKIKSKVSLLELRDESIDDLLRMLKPHCTGKDKSPVVCVDYLQIIPPSADQRLTSDKAKIDDIVHKLKSFQRETNTTFIVVSSFNRMNYYQQVSFESFKESGNIEYSADVVWALQLNVVNDIKIGAAISDTRQKFDDAKKHQPRELQLKCLKNRQGNNYDAFFFYFSSHDYFQPCQFEDFIKPPLSYQNDAQNNNKSSDKDEDKD